MEKGLYSPPEMNLVRLIRAPGILVPGKMEQWADSTKTAYSLRGREDVRWPGPLGGASTMGRELLLLSCQHVSRMG